MNPSKNQTSLNQSPLLPSMSASPCAACKYLRRKCQQNCVFAPHFDAEQSSNFVSVHRVFGASNVTKLLNELQPKYREDAVKSLVYEAEMRIRDPVYGCVGVISILHQNLRSAQIELSVARAELARYRNAVAAAASFDNGFSGGGLGDDEIGYGVDFSGQFMA